MSYFKLWKWGLGISQAKSIETVHMQFCKRMLGIKQSTQNDFVHGELGRVDYQSLRNINIVKFWLKIIHADQRKYIKCIYNMMLTDIELRPNKQNWASMVKNLLSRLGFLEVWNAQGVGNINNFLYIFKTRVRDIYIYTRLAFQTWKLNKSKVLHKYIKFWVSKIFRSIADRKV